MPSLGLGFSMTAHPRRLAVHKKANSFPLRSLGPSRYPKCWVALAPFLTPKVPKPPHKEALTTSQGLRIAQTPCAEGETEAQWTRAQDSGLSDSSNASSTAKCPMRSWGNRHPQTKGCIPVHPLQALSLALDSEPEQNPPPTSEMNLGLGA